MSDGLAFQWYDIENDPRGWDRQVADVGQNLFHRNAILEVHQSGKAFRRGVLITRVGQPVGLVGGLLRPGHGGGRFRSLSFPQFRTGLDPLLPRTLGNWLLRQGVTRIDLGSLDGGVEGYQNNPFGRTFEQFEFIYDLVCGEDERLERVTGDHRCKLERSEQESMRLCRIRAGQALLMTRLQRQCARRRGETFGLRRMVERYQFYRRLTERMAQDGSASLYGLCDKRGRILALAYMLERTGSSFYMSGAESEEGHASGAAVRLLWELARGYPHAGITTLNLGSVSAGARDQGHKEHGLYRFKAGFGVEPIVRQSLVIEA